jgi:transposase
MPETRPASLAEFRRQMVDLVRLRRENRQLKLERDILSRATAWFARETGVLPSGSSGS